MKKYLEIRKKNVIFVIYIVYTFMQREEIGINVYGVKELSQIGVSAMLEATNEDGIAFISKYNQPAAMVLPISMSGIKKAMLKIAKIMEEANNKDEEFAELFNSLFTFLERVK
jgi:hypothetical protein